MNSRMPHRSAGFTLIEMMISLVLGLLVLGAIGSVYIGSKRTSTTRDAMAMLQENGRIAIRHLQAGIAPAGYPMEDSIPSFIYSDVTDAAEETVLVAATKDGIKRLTTDATACSDLTTDASGEAYVACPDSITISFAARTSGYEADCLGSTRAMSVGGQALMVNRFFVENGVLKCQGSSNTSSQPIAEGVENMQILYGVELDDRKLMLTAKELNAWVVKDGEDQVSWNTVSVVQVALLVSSIKTGFTKNGDSTTYQLLGESITIPSDGRAYRVFTTTIPLRNRKML